MYHLRFRGDHYAMGVKRGGIFNKCGLTFPLETDDFQMRHGIGCEAVLRQYFPEVCEEIRGITDTINADYMRFMSWMLAMGCCMYNLEENLPREVRGCTAFAAYDGNGVFYGRNNDLPPVLKSGCKSEIYAPDGGYRFNITTSSFVNGEEGLNEKGLAVAMTFVSTRPEEIEAGFTSEFLVRYLLQKSDSTRTALKMLSDVPVSSNCNILLADRSGDMLVAECSPRERNIRLPERTSGGLAAVCTVNSFVSEKMKRHEWQGEEDYSSGLRYDRIFHPAAVGRAGIYVPVRQMSEF